MNSQIGSCDKESISSVHTYVIKFKVIFWTSKKKVYASTNSVIPLFCICSEKKSEISKSARCASCDFTGILIPCI